MGAGMVTLGPSRRLNLLVVFLDLYKNDELLYHEMYLD